MALRTGLKGSLGKKGVLAFYFDIQESFSFVSQEVLAVIKRCFDIMFQLKVHFNILGKWKQEDSMYYKPMG